MFFLINFPKLLLKKEDTFERTIFSLVCATVAFGGNLLVGSIAGVLEAIQKGAYTYGALGDVLLNVLFSLVLVILCIAAADYFCGIPILRKRNAVDYSYEKASGSLFYLSFILGLGGNKIINPVLLAVSLVVNITQFKPAKRLPSRIWQSFKSLKNSFVSRFIDTTVSSRLVTEAVLGSLSMPAAFLSRTPAGGVFKMKVNDPSVKMLISAGTISPARLFVRALYSLQNAIRLIP